MGQNATGGHGDGDNPTLVPKLDADVLRRFYSADTVANDIRYRVVRPNRQFEKTSRKRKSVKRLPKKRVVKRRVRANRDVSNCR